MEKSWAGKQDPTAGSSNDFTFLTGVVEDVCVMETWNPEKVASWNQAPKLHYCLDYDRQKAELFVTRLEGMLLADFHGLLCVCLPGHLWLGEHRGLDEHSATNKTLRRVTLRCTGVFLSLVYQSKLGIPAWRPSFLQIVIQGPDPSSLRPPCGLWLAGGKMRRIGRGHNCPLETVTYTCLLPIG